MLRKSFTFFLACVFIPSALKVNYLIFSVLLFPSISYTPLFSSNKRFIFSVKKSTVISNTLFDDKNFFKTFNKIYYFMRTWW